MFEKNLLCYECGKTYPVRTIRFRCDGCNGSLEVAFDYAKLKARYRGINTAKRPFGHMRYSELFPVKAPIQAGEGGTPMMRSHNLESLLNLDFQLWFKLEYQNPTGSFKDRGSSVEVAKALEFIRSGAQKKPAAVCASTGNMGASVAAYSGIANLDCSIFTPSDAAPIKLEQILAHGAKVYRTRGDYTKAAKLVESAHERHGLYLLGDYLYRREGTKSVGFELAEQLPGADYVFSPVGNGTLVSAVWKALKEFRLLGLGSKKKQKTPKLAGIQSSGCNPVTKAFRKGGEIRPVCGSTLAVAIECGNPLDGQRALDSVNESGGFADDVTDRQILKARELLAEHEGIFPEPAGAVSLAGLIKAGSQGRIKKGSKVICLITGHGLKVPYTGVRGKAKQLKPAVLKSLF